MCPRKLDPTMLAVLASLPLPPLGPLGELVDNTRVEDVHATSGAGLLSLEPRLQTDGVENVVAGKLLAARHHLLTTDDAHIVDSFQFLDGGIRVATKKDRFGGVRGETL